MLSIEMLPALQGDCLWIEYARSGEPTRRILIDGGPARSYAALRQRLIDRLHGLDTDQRTFELLVITHIDEDHIGGVLELLVERPLGVTFKDVWFNSWEHLPGPPDDTLGAVAGEQVSAILQRGNAPRNTPFAGGAVMVRDQGTLPRIDLGDGLNLTLLSPTETELRKLRPRWAADVKEHHLVAGSAEQALEALRRQRDDLPPDLLGDEAAGPLRPRELVQKLFVGDDSPTNASSIAFLLEFDGRAVLMTGDGSAEVLSGTVARLRRERGLDRLTLDAVKLAHHGSKYNTSLELLEQLACDRFLFSTNGTFRHRHPNSEAVARVLLHRGGRGRGAPRQLLFNYSRDTTRRWSAVELQREFGYQAIYPPLATEGLTLPL